MREAVRAQQHDFRRDRTRGYDDTTAPCGAGRVWTAPGADGSTPVTEITPPNGTDGAGSSINTDGAVGGAALRPRRRAASRAAGPPAQVDEAATDVRADEPAIDPAAPVKKAARKRAPRKATAAPAEPVAVAALPEASTVETEATAVEDLPIAKKAARKRAVRKSAAPPPVDPQPEVFVSDELVLESAPAEPPAATKVPLLFQAPDVAVAPARRPRRASAKAGPPVVHEQAPAEAPSEPVVGVEPAVEVTAETVAGEQGEDYALDDSNTESSSDDDGSSDEGSGAGRKRRRRGGRGRRPRTEDDESADSATPAEQVGDQDGEQDGDGEDDDESGSASSRRRRRRRRRAGGGSGDGEVETAEDPPGTVTRVRPPRRVEDEVASVRGSTRLEAKKQRRRDGRDASRRKPTITESEFLARRESVQRAMIVRESAGRTQIAVLEDGVLVEHYVANETNTSMIGNVYLGRVQNVLPSMEAAFVDIGKGRNAVLYAGEVNWDAAGLDGQPRRIESALKSGDTVLVQVTKDPMGHKGARLTSQVSLPGRYLVYVPNNSMTGISRKLPDTERTRLKRILKAVVPDKAGVIVRTAAEGASEEELSQDVARLTEQWAEIEKKAASTSGGSAPKVLYGEPDLTIRVVRDVFNEDFTSLLVSGEGAWGVVQPYLVNVAPDLADRVTRWTSDQDVFVEHRIDEQLAKAMDRKVWLPSGGSLVIDRTEAMTVVDVNTGKFIGAGGNLEETVTRNNLEAAEEVVRQLRLRDIGGIIVVDFIDMVLEVNRDLVLRRLLECLGRDRTKHQVAEVTSLGLVQMTRKRVGQGLLEVFSELCEHCAGRGVVIHSEPVERRGNGDGPSTSAAGSGGGASSGGGQNGGRSSRRGRGGEQAAVVEPPPVRQPIPAGFVASLVHHDEPPVGEPAPIVQPAVQPPVEPVVQSAVQPPDEPVVQPPVEVEVDVEPVVEPTRPARRRRRASAPSGPPPSQG